MKKVFLKSLLLLCALIVGSTSVWAENKTKTEGFETATAESTYNTTKDYSTDDSDCGIAWTMYYGCVSGDVKLAGDKSAQMRWYSSAKTNYCYIKNTTPVVGLSNVAFKARVSNTGLKMEVSYSADGSSWTVKETKTFSGTTATDCSYEIPSGNKYIKIGVSSSGTAPSSGNYKLTIDNVVFTYVTHELTYSSSNGSITVKDANNNTIASGSQVAEGSILNITASGNPGYAFDGWSVTGTGSSVASTENASTTFTMGTTDASLTAAFEADVTEYTVTCNSALNGSVSANHSSAYSGTLITLNIVPSFRYYTKSVIVTDEDENEVLLTKTGNNTYTFNMPASNVTASATFDNTYTDALNRELTERTGTTYGSWSGKSSASSAIYAGYSAGGNNSIQMKKASEDSGIITTASGGYARKITVTWNSNTKDNRTLKVWGSNTTFASINNMTSATELGTIIKGTNTELSITGDYQFIGMEGSGGAIYLDEIDVKWETTTTAKISINAACTDGSMYYGTFSLGTAFVVPSDLIVSEIGIVDKKLYVEDYETGAVVPANTGVMISSLEAGNHTITLSSEAGTSVLGSDNMLKPSGDAGITTANMDEANTTFYRLTMHEGTQIGFWWGAEDGAAFDLAANKAYLAVPNDALLAPAHYWIVNEEHNATNIENIEANEKAVKFIEDGRILIKKNGIVYDALGRVIR